MGRIRTIKPEILLDRKAAKLPDDAWRLWVSMWVIADDLGRLPADPAMLAGQVFWGKPDPFDAASRALASLRESSMVAFYEVRGEPYAQSLGWKRHQKIDRPSGPKFPSPDDVVTHQLSIALASPREPSRSIDPDHDRDHDLIPESAGHGEQENLNESGDRERVPAGPVDNPTVELLAQELADQLAPHPSKKPRKSRAGANGEASVKPATPKVEAPPPPAEAFTLAHLLLHHVSGNHPESRIAKSPEKVREHTALMWATTIDRMNRLDGHAYPTIQKVITWCARHRYWSTIVLGADVLRAKWDKLIAEASRDAPRAQAAKPGPTAQSLATLERLEAEEREKQQP